MVASSPWPDQSSSDPSSIRSSPDFQRLVRVLILGSNFQFLLALGDSPRVVQEAVDELPAAVEAAGGDPIRVTVVRPRHDLVGDEAFSALADSLQHALTTAPPEGSEFRRVLLLDGSGVGSEEVPIWAELFRRLNEQRNTIARTFPESMIFWLTQTLLQTLSVEAPDLWSVRSAFLQFDTLPQPAVTSEHQADIPRSGEISPEADHSSSDPARAATDVATAREQLQLRPHDSVARWSLALALGRLVEASVARGQISQGLSAAEESNSLLVALAEQDPDRADYQTDLSVSHDNLGDLYRALGQGEQARQSYEGALKIRQRLAQREPHRADYRRDVSVSHERLGDLHAALGQGDQAREAYECGLKIALGLAQREPHRADYQTDLWVSYNKLGDLSAALGEADRARQAYEDALKIAETLARQQPERTDYQRNLSGSYNKLGDLCAALGQAEQARQAYESALKIRLRLAQQEPHRADFQRDLSVSYGRMGDLYSALGQVEQAREAYESDLRIALRLAEREPDRADYQRDLSVSYERMGELYAALRQAEQARQAYRDSLNLRLRLVEQHPDRADYQTDLIVSLVRLADASPIEARETLSLALEIAEGLERSGRLKPGLAWMPADLRRRLAALG